MVALSSFHSYTRIETDQHRSTPPHPFLERLYPRAQYQKSPSGSGSWSISPFEPPQNVPWIPIDPLAPDFDQFPRFRYARPLQVTLRPGDLLYLPSLWFHHVRQTRGSDSEGLAIAVNWYV
jgi:jumonji domain-containing protein 7